MADFWDSFRRLDTSKHVEVGSEVSIFMGVWDKGVLGRRH